MTIYEKLSEADLDTIKALAEEQRDDRCVEIVEKRKAYVFRFENNRPYVVPKDVIK